MRKTKILSNRLYPMKAISGIEEKRKIKFLNTLTQLNENKLCTPKK
jgi:hypothetical protein